MNFKDFYSFKEGLIRTYPLEIAVKNLNSRFEDYMKELFYIEDDCIFGVTLDPKYIPLDKIISYATSLGYFLGKKYDMYKSVRLIFLPKYSVAVNPEDEGDFFYHFAPNSVLDKIKKMGLVPKQTRKKDWPHPGERIYLLGINFNKVNLKNAYDVIDSSLGILSNISATHDKKSSDYSVIKISKKKLGNIPLYSDPSFPKNYKAFSGSEIERKNYGLYTTSNIPPSSFVKILTPNEFSDDIINTIIGKEKKK